MEDLRSAAQLDVPKIPDHVGVTGLSHAEADEFRSSVLVGFGVTPPCFQWLVYLRARRNWVIFLSLVCRRPRVPDPAMPHLHDLTQVCTTFASLVESFNVVLILRRGTRRTLVRVCGLWRVPRTSCANVVPTLVSFRSLPNSIFRNLSFGRSHVT